MNNQYQHPNFPFGTVLNQANFYKGIHSSVINKVSARKPTLELVVEDDYGQNFHLFYSLSKHACKRILNRSISISLVQKCLLHGELICKYGLSFYILKTKQFSYKNSIRSCKRRLPLVLVCNDNTGEIITAYWLKKGMAHLRK